MQAVPNPINEETRTFESFREIRDTCLALRQVFLRDEDWEQFQDWHSRPDEVAAHRSVLLLAFERGYLSRVTGPIHKYILSADGILSNARNQYLRDLREKWMCGEDPVRRNQLSKRFRGRVVELQFASYLESKANKIVGLEATREGPDIETMSPDGGRNTFEVKFIGVEDGDFRIFLESIAGLDGAAFVSPYTAINYLLFRVYEAACQ